MKKEEMRLFIDLGHNSTFDQQLNSSFCKKYIFSTNKRQRKRHTQFVSLMNQLSAPQRLYVIILSCSENAARFKYRLSILIVVVSIIHLANDQSAFFVYFLWLLLEFDFESYKSRFMNMKKEVMCSFEWFQVWFEFFFKTSSVTCFQDDTAVIHKLGIGNFGLSIMFSWCITHQLPFFQASRRFLHPAKTIPFLERSRNWI